LYEGFQSYLIYAMKSVDIVERFSKSAV